MERTSNASRTRGAPVGPLKHIELPKARGTTWAQAVARSVSNAPPDRGAGPSVLRLSLPNSFGSIKRRKLVFVDFHMVTFVLVLLLRW